MSTHALYGLIEHELALQGHVWQHAEHVVGRSDSVKQVVDRDVNTLKRVTVVLERRDLNMAHHQCDVIHDEAGNCRPRTSRSKHDASPA